MRRSEERSESEAGEGPAREQGSGRRRREHRRWDGEKERKGRKRREGAKGQSIVGVKEGVEEGGFKGTLTITGRAKEDEVANARVQAQYSGLSIRTSKRKSQRIKRAAKRRLNRPGESESEDRRVRRKNQARC